MNETTSQLLEKQTEKLVYVNNTKSKLKNEINKIGGSITNETTFRDYVSNIKSIYDKLPKIEGSGSDITLNDTEEALLSLTPEGYVSQGILPSDYMQVEYIESTGEQYINTNYIPNENTRIIAKTTFNTGCLFGTIDNEEIKSIVLAGAKGPNTWAEYARIFSTGGVQIPYNFINTAEDTVYEIEMTNSEAKIILNNKSYIANYTRENQNITTPLYIFARNTGNEAISFTQRKLYNFKIYNSNVLVRDYIPCYRKLDGEIGLYDLVNNIFYTNQGTGTFLHGNVIPNPDYPQPIKVVTGEQNVEIGGKNLFDKDNTRIIKMYIAQQSDYVATKTTLQNRSFIIPCQPNTTYTISKKNVTSEFRATTVNEYIPDPTSTEQHYDCYNKVLNNSGTIITITTDSLSKYLVVNYANLNNDSETASLNEMMVEEGSTATEYEPYYTPQNYPLSLGNIELAKIGNYKDYIFKNEIGSPYYNADLDLNGWYKYEAIRKRIFDGSEEWGFQNNSSTPTPRTVLKLNIGNFIAGGYYSNYFIYNSQTSNRIVVNSMPTLYLSLDNTVANIEESDGNSTRVQKIKLWLSTHNTIFYYCLFTPTYEKITDTTLIQQLENMNNNARSYKGTTIIECSSVSEENETLQVSTVALKDLDLLTEEETSSTNNVSEIQSINEVSLNSIEEIESEVSE